MSPTKRNTDKYEFERELWGLAGDWAGELRKAQDIMRAELRKTGKYSEDELQDISNPEICAQSELWLRENVRTKLIEMTHESSTELRHGHSIIMLKLIDAALADVDFDSVNSMTWHLPEMQ